MKKIGRLFLSVSLILSLILIPTGSSLGAVEHDCSKYLISKYDTSNHWDECSVCGSKFNVIAHDFNEYWTMGDSCSANNKQVHQCKECGYSYKTNNTREHTWSDWVMDERRHRKCCTVCHTTMEGTLDYHTDENGNKLNCQNPGKCALCGYNAGNHGYNTNYNTITRKYTGSTVNDTVSCLMCNKIMVDCKNNIIEYETDGTSFTYSMIMPLEEALDTSTIKSTSASYSGGSKLVEFNGTIEVIDYANSVSGQAVKIESSGVFSGDEATSGYVFAIRTTDATFIIGVFLYPDITAPTFTSIQYKDLAYSNGWTTKRQFTINGTENYCSNVTLDIRNSSNKQIGYGSTAVTDGKWSYTFTPDIEVNGTETYTVKMTDFLGNSSTSTFSTSNIDGVAPTVTTSSKTNEDWSKSKDVTFTCTDKGSGNVYMSLDGGDYEEMTKSGSNYSTVHTFTGDVYGSETHEVSYKDYTENIASSSISVYNLDNTAPTISKLEVTKGVGSSTITVTANDINQKLGKSGSGVSEYGLSSSKDIQPTSWQTSNVLSTTKKGTQYVWVKDLVGNISVAKSADVDIYCRTTFDTQGGTCITPYKDCSYGSTYGELPSVTKAGWVFEGWVDSDGNIISDTSIVPSLGNVTLYANYSVGTTTALINCNVDSSSVIYDKGSPTYIVKVSGVDISGEDKTYVNAIKWNKSEDDLKSLSFKINSGTYDVSVLNTNNYLKLESQDIDTSNGINGTVSFSTEEINYSGYSGNNLSITSLK